MKKIEIKILLISFICGLAIFISPGFFKPNTYYNWGDILFPLEPVEFIRLSYYTWSSMMGYGLANSWPVFFPIYAIIYLLWLIKIPLWIINRLWMVLPFCLLGSFTFYLYKSIFEDEKEELGGIITAIFAIFLPYIFGSSFLTISLAAFPFFLGSLLKGLKYPEKALRYAFYTGISIWMLSFSPRTLYISVLIAILYLIAYFFLIEQLTLKSVKFFALCLVCTLLLNLFWILPVLSYNLFSSNFVAKTMENNSNLFTSRIQLLFDYAGWYKLSWVLRIIPGCPFSSTYPYFKIPYIAFLTFFVPFYAFFSVYFVKKKNIYPLVITTFFVSFLATGVSYPGLSAIYKFLFLKLPGFIILNNPLYWLVQLGKLYAVLFGLTTSHILKKKYFHKFKISFFILLMIFIIVIFGQPISIGWTPKKNIWGNVTYPNHLPSMKIPEEYFQLNQFLSKYKNSGFRILNLPWNHGGYVSYKWWHYYSIPDLINSFSSMEVFGTNFAPDPDLKEILISLSESDFKNAFSACTKFNIKFILVHKDYYPIPSVFIPSPEAEFYLDGFNKSTYLKRVLDNAFFSLYEIAIPSSGLFYKTIKNKTTLITDPIKSEIKPKNIYPLKFDGKTYIVIPHSESLAIKDSISICAWVYPEKLDSFQGVAMKWAASGDKNDNYGLAVNKDNVMVTPLNIKGNDFIPSWQGVREGRWNFLSFVFNNYSGAQVAYLNGKSQGATNIQGQLSSSDVPLLIGANNGFSPMCFFKGYIYNVQIYVEALESKEIKELYLGGINSLPLKNKKIAGHWFINKSKDSVIEDLSGNQNNGYIKGTIKWDIVQEPQVSISEDSKEIIETEPVNFKMFSPVYYELNLNSNEPFYLVFNERFHKLWECYVNGRKIKNHIRTRLGENKWFIEDKGNLTIKITYGMQRIFDIGLIISSFSFLLILSTFLIKKIWAR